MLAAAPWLVTGAAAQESAPELTAAQFAGASVILTYDQALDESRTPPRNAYVVRINRARASVQAVSVSGSQVTLTVSPAADDDASVLVTYRHRARPTLRSAAGVNAGTVRNMAAQHGLPELTTTSETVTVETYEPPAPQAAARQVSGQGASGQAASNFVPTSFSYTLLNRGVRFTWGAPPTGSGTVQKYELRHGSSADLTGATPVDKGTDLRHDVNPGAGIAVYAQVRAQDSDNTYGSWTYVLHGTGNRQADRTAPAAPAAPTVTAGDAKLTVTWTAPADNGNSITKYQILYGRSNLGTDRWTTLNAWSIGDGNLSETIAGLRNGTTYGVQVRAISAAGRSDWSATTTGTPAVAAARAPSATIAADSATITEGGNAVYTVTLSSAPSTNVDVKYDITTTGSFGVTAATDQTVTVNSGGTTGTITLSTADDSVDEDNGSVTVTLKAGTGYTLGTTTSAAVAVNDNDTAGVSVVGSPLAVTEGSFSSYSLVLTSEPTGNVVVTITSSDTALVGTNKTSVTFTSGNWDTAQSVQVTAHQDDDDIDDDTVTITHAINAGSTADSKYDAVTGIGSVTVNITDDDEPYLHFNNTYIGSGANPGSPENPMIAWEPSDKWRFGPAEVFELALSHQPSSDVVVEITSSNANLLKVQTWYELDSGYSAPAASARITFDENNWDCVQEFTGTGRDAQPFTSCIAANVDLIPQADVTDNCNDETVTVTIRVVDSESDDDFDGIANIVLNVTVVDFGNYRDSGTGPLTTCSTP